MSELTPEQLHIARVRLQAISEITANWYTEWLIRSTLSTIWSKVFQDVDPEPPIQETHDGEPVKEHG